MQRYRQSFRPRSIKRLERKAKQRFIITIGIFLVLAYFLITWGLPFLIGSLSVFNKFKDPGTKKTVVEDPAIAPPVLNIPFESTNSAQLSINGYSSPNSKVELYFDDELKTTVIVDADGGFSSEPISLVLGTNNIYGKTINENNKQSLQSKTIKVFYDNEKPKLELSEPSDNLEIKGGDKKVKVSGTTDPDNSISVNGTTVIVNSEGKFETVISINDGENTITISATNQYGNNNQLQRKVIFTPS